MKTKPTREETEEQNLVLLLPPPQRIFWIQTLLPPLRAILTEGLPLDPYVGWKSHSQATERNDNRQGGKGEGGGNPFQTEGGQKNFCHTTPCKIFY